MSLPPLLRHVYNHGSEEVIRRGKKIFYNSGVSLQDVDHLLEQVRFRVRNDMYQNYYTVTVSRFMHADQLALRCQCPYNLGEICRHEVAAMFQLNDMMQSGFFENTSVSYDQKHTVVRLRQVNESILRVFTSAQNIDKAVSWAKVKKAIITSNQNNVVTAEVPDGDETFLVSIKQNEERYFDTSCTCDETRHPLCLHKTTLFLQLLNTFGPQYFQAMRNWDEQKNKLLSLYGYSLNDDLTGKFAFTYEHGKPFLRVLDPTIKKTSAPALPLKVETVVAEPESPGSLGIVVNSVAQWYPFIEVALVEGEVNDEKTAFTGRLEKLDLQQFINASHYAEQERELLPMARKLSAEELMKYMRKNLPFGEFLDDYKTILKETPANDIKDQILEYLLPKYKKLAEKYTAYPLTFLRGQGKKYNRSELQPVSFTDRPVRPHMFVSYRNNAYTVALEWIIEGAYIPWQEASLLGGMLVHHEDKIYVLSQLSEVRFAEQFMPDGLLTVPACEWPEFLEHKLLGWSREIATDFTEDLTERIEDLKPEYRIYLNEREQMFILQPVFAYEGREVRANQRGDVVSQKNGKIQIIERNDEAEQRFLKMLRELHNDIQFNQRDQFFYLPSSLVLSKNWFFRFTDTMKEWNVGVYGLDNMRNLRINSHRPETQIQVSSGIDWFDASIQVTFGDQAVTISDIKKALSQKQNFVKLGDGSLGLLPEEWLKKYALMVKMGEHKNGKLRLRKIHFSVLDELLSEIDEQAIYDELEEKKERLSDIISNDYTLVTPSETLKERLRPYQLAGFQWLVFLKEAGWGGILADDMGLGKTVQTLSFFQYYKRTDPGAVFLVVCPTTLMHNWQREIEKFAPELTNHIHHGPKRTLRLEDFRKHDVIITTYGTMRSDIKLFKEFEFSSIVLDESQAIKNPQSQVTKAASLLNAQVRLALSGTPLQNNTFDLYAQMNFLNPGMLGSREFFMNEFATPIDRFQDDEAKQQLRKLIYPFLLRRTKEQVAKDLPPKTETVLYCEMGREQRKVYDTYRSIYREQIMNIIEEKGIERSQFHVLQGLTKLRQICDSPAILNEEEKHENHSVKIEELTREITENTGDHKVLIFSQFLGMLSLIRQKLEHMGVPYVYFDGSSSTSEREKAIHEFQNEERCRVFLISLKAGGVGLNLTAADYVYIVDPWWNPAVEQQAIDRTHRIGQTKSIFAYRLICTDTIEEKMMLLQESKRALAGELIADDSAIIKRLTKEDIAFLLS